MSETIIEFAEDIKKVHSMKYKDVDYNGDDNKFVIQLCK